MVGLCLTCRHARRTVNDRGSVFYRCELARTNPDFPKYPALPVLSCSGREEVEDDRSRPEIAANVRFGPGGTPRKLFK